LVRRGLFATRSEAKRAIEEGRVTVPGTALVTPATMISPATAASIAAAPEPFVSRGGSKLDGALEDLDVRVEGRRWLDAGASTGGFTDRLLQGGASAVIAVDVGYGQLDWKLRNDERVTVLERTNIRDLEPRDLPFFSQGAVADLSFISLRLVIPSLVNLVEEDADLLLMVKPQFEVGKGRVGKGGVVRDPELWKESITAVADVAEDHGYRLVGTAVSRVPGPAGNREFFVHLRQGVAADRDSIERAIGEVT
jgi:23S rRNA (cytidine1920-2'-O)/16S rRNA (cytidine1409-2'-O)-methyltransferase